MAKYYVMRWAFFNIVYIPDGTELLCFWPHKSFLGNAYRIATL
jgi:hypothetical protein